MHGEEKHPYRVYWVGGRRFPAYPDFMEHPEYTDEGRPFAKSAQESYPHAKSKAPDKPLPGDCGSCGWFYREQTPCDPIGVCMCDARWRELKSDKEE